MYMFKHIDAKTVSDALSNLVADSIVIAGGTELIPRLRAMISPSQPKTVVNLKTINGTQKLDEIIEIGGLLKIGALTKLNDIAESKIIQQKYTALAEAAGRVGGYELRNMATIGGNICQQVRCWYYRHEYNRFPCLRKKGSATCFARDINKGDNRYHSIFGMLKQCLAVNPSDIAPALIALNAKIIITSAKGTTPVDAAKFFTVDGERTTILKDAEIVTEIQIPAPAAGTTSSFAKFAIRKAMDFAIVSCAAVITIQAGNVTDYKVCLNGVHNNPYEVTNKISKKTLLNKPLGKANAEIAGNEALAGAKALANNSYKIDIAKAMVEKAILNCA